MSAPSPSATPGAMARSDWEQRYREGRTFWDLGGPPPALVRVIREQSAGASQRVLVPGAGFGHDALAWARAGHHVTAVDVASTPCVALAARAQRAGLTVTTLESDVLALPASLDGSFDLVWEQTCLCALPPERRADYVEAMARVLVPGGRFVALLWNHGAAGGPPFDLTPTLVRALFEPSFLEERLEPVPDSVPGRGPEFLLVTRTVTPRP